MLLLGSATIGTRPGRRCSKTQKRFSRFLKTAQLVNEKKAKGRKSKKMPKRNLAKVSTKATMEAPEAEVKTDATKARLIREEDTATKFAAKCRLWRAQTAAEKEAKKKAEEAAKKKADEEKAWAGFEQCKTVTEYEEYEYATHPHE